MLSSVKRLEGFAIGATDGAIGKLKDFYFDDEAWVIRYLVVDTSAWLGGREVLVAPYSIGPIDWAGNSLSASITKAQVKDSPNVDTDKPVSRQFERGYLGYYGYPYYWGGTGLWGETYYPGNALIGIDGDHDGYRGHLRAPSADVADGDPHLRSCNAVKGYHIRAKDGEIGHVQGFLVDDSTWSIRYLIVNTSNWWMGHQVLISPEWIETVSWLESAVAVDLARQTIKDAPVYEDDSLVDRDAEIAIYRHYGRNGYWRGRREAELV